MSLNMDSREATGKLKKAIEEETVKASAVKVEKTPHKTIKMENSSKIVESPLKIKCEEEVC